MEKNLFCFYLCLPWSFPLPQHNYICFIKIIYEINSCGLTFSPPIRYTIIDQIVYSFSLTVRIFFFFRSFFRLKLSGNWFIRNIENIFCYINCNVHKTLSGLKLEKKPRSLNRTLRTASKKEKFGRKSAAKILSNAERNFFSYTFFKNE